MYAKAIEEVLKMMWLLVIWKIKRPGVLKVEILLMEYDNDSASK
jgi:hypothetical protein